MLIEAAGVTGSDTECFGSLGLAQLQVDQEGDLWVAFQASGGARVCRYYLDAGTAACSTLDLDRCSAFAVSRDGSRFACSVSDYADDEERVSVFDAATAAQVDELAFSSDGAWHFFDNDTIAVLDDDLELTTISIG